MPRRGEGGGSVSMRERPARHSVDEESCARGEPRQGQEILGRHGVAQLVSQCLGIQRAHLEDEEAADVAEHRCGRGLVHLCEVLRWPR